jgi:hypothetical protein
VQAFYESLPDLVAIIPSILYKDSKEEAEAEKRKGEEEKEEKANKEQETDDFEEDLQPDEEEVEEVNLEEDEDLQEAINLSSKMVFDAFLGTIYRAWEGGVGRGKFIGYQRLPAGKERVHHLMSFGV